MRTAIVAAALALLAGLAIGQELRTIGTMQVNKEGNDLVIRVPYHDPKLSGSGKHLTIASGRTTVELDGRAVVVQVNAYTPEAR